MKGKIYKKIEHIFTYKYSSIFTSTSYSMNDNFNSGNKKEQMKNDICNLLVQRLEEGYREEEAIKKANESRQLEAKIRARQEYNVMPFHIQTVIPQ